MTGSGEPIGGDDLVAAAVADRIVRLARTLQSRGVDVSLAEIIDANEAAAIVDLGRRGDLDTALRATMVKDPRHFPLFDRAFDRLFPARSAPAGEPSPSTGPGPAPASVVADGGDLRALATELVDQHGGLEGEVRGEGHHLQRAYRGTDLAKLMSDARRLAPDLSSDELRNRIEQLKRLMAAEVRANLGPGDPDPADDDITDVDFQSASRAELDGIEEAIRPLARKIAARLARRRQSLNRGKVNLRKTTRRSLTNGGVPLEVALDRPRPRRPELFILCDVSGSVADFALFTLTLMSALSAQVANARSFIFADAVDEVTALLAATDHGIEPWQLLRNTGVIATDGHSDYGAVLDQFWTEVGQRDLRPTSTVIVAGDARSNYRQTNAEALGWIGRRARRVYWLNPEPRAEWNSHDSVLDAYAEHCSQVFEVRNLSQLRHAVEQIL